MSEVELPVFAWSISENEYMSGRGKKLHPEELTDEFYYMRRLFPTSSSSPEEYALEVPVSLERVVDKSEYYSVRFEFAHPEPNKYTEPERVLTVDVDGFILIADSARKGFLRRKSKVQVEHGYFVEPDWEDITTKLLNTYTLNK